MTTEAVIKINAHCYLPHLSDLVQGLFSHRIHVANHNGGKLKIFGMFHSDFDIDWVREVIRNQTKSLDERVSQGTQ